jgi:hypothetical protein
MQRRLNNYQTFPQLDLSGGVQRKTSHLLRRRNEVKSSKNAAFNIKIGSAVRRPGYEKVGPTIQHGNDSLGATVFRYGQYNKIIVGINDAANANATVQYLDSDNYWKNLITDAPANCRFNFLNSQDYLYIAGKVPGVNDYMTLSSIDKNLTVSTSKNVYAAPKARFITEYQGQMVAINCQLDGITYPDRAYFSSPPLGAVTFIQTDQRSILNSLRVDSVQYLKAGMQVDIYKAGTEAKLVSSLTIVSIDKNNKRFTFQPQSLNVSDNDEVWLAGTKNTLSRFWNTDYPTNQNADFIQVPPGKDESPAFTGHGQNNNRLFLFTRNSFMKYDGSNLITISDAVGCVAHESIRNIGSWTLWLHTSGVWGYNDNTGELKLMSRGMEPYIQAINQINLSTASAVVVGKSYKLSLGELLPLESVTTSTSTSSTTTSTTSTSYSSTSTSSTSTSTTTAATSTSTSSTSRSTSTSSISTSSTSVSTSSTSTSSTSTSLSTSTSSTTTTTLASTKKVTRLVFDYDMQAWWPEEHKREFRFQFNHTMHGYTKPYFTDETGRLFRDETGNLDNFDTIPMEVEFGRNNFGTDQLKEYLSILVDSENARGGVIQYSLDNGSFNTLGQTVETSTKLSFPTNGQLKEGHDINFKFVHNDPGAAPAFNGLSTYFKIQEIIVNEL